MHIRLVYLKGAAVADEVNFEIIPRADLRSERVLRFDLWWHRAAGDRRCPSRADIDPAEFKDILPYFLLADIGHEPFTISYRLSGTRIAEYDQELTGSRLEDIQNASAAERAAIRKLYETVCATWQPVYMRGFTESPLAMGPIPYEGGIWPLSSDGVRIDKCAGIHDMIFLTG